VNNKKPGFQFLRAERFTKHEVLINLPGLIVNRGLGTAETFRVDHLTEVLDQEHEPLLRPDATPEESYTVTISGPIQTGAGKDSRNRRDNRRYGEIATYDLADLPPEIRDMLIGADALRALRFTAPSEWAQGHDVLIADWDGIAAMLTGQHRRILTAIVKCDPSGREAENPILLGISLVVPDGSTWVVGPTFDVTLPQAPMRYQAALNEITNRLALRGVFREEQYQFRTFPAEARRSVVEP